MPPSPRSLLCPTMLMPRKWCLSGGGSSQQAPPPAPRPGPLLPAPGPTPAQGARASPMLSVTVMMFRDMVESVMLLKDEAWEGRAQVRLWWQHRPRPALPPATYAVCLPQALLPPPPLVLPDEPGGGALLSGAAQPGVADGGAWGSGGTKVRGAEVRGWRGAAGRRCLHTGIPPPPRR